MLCLCRRVRKQESNRPENVFQIVYRKATFVDYSAIYPTFTAILVKPFENEYAALRHLSDALGQWAHCQAGECIPTMTTFDGVPVETKRWKGPKLAAHAWDSETASRGANIYYKVESGKSTGSVLTVDSALGSLPGWTESKAPLWNFFWRFLPAGSEPVLVWQRRSRNRNVMVLGAKDRLKLVMDGCRQCAGHSVFEVMPITFQLHGQYDEFVQEFQARQASGRPNMWLLKPANRSGGRGLKLVTSPETVAGVDGLFIIQHYVNRSLLVKGYKFDLRLFVLVTSYMPLEAYIYHRPLVRFCKTKYTSDPTVKYAHVSNISQQKHNPDIGLFNGKCGCEYPALKELLAEQGISWDVVWNKVKDCVVQSLTCAESRVGSMPGHFDLIGLDVLLDEDCRPWLLEANSHPSLEAFQLEALDIRPDYFSTLVKGVAAIIDPIPFDRHALSQIVQRRLQEFGTPRSPEVEQEQLNEDLSRVLRGRVPRKYGQLPEDLGQFEVLAPSPAYTRHLQLQNTTCSSSEAQ